MKKKLDWARVWVQVEDSLVPALRLAPCERALYYHLLRHSRLLGRRTLQVSKRALARTAGLSLNTVMSRIRSLARRGCIRVVERSYGGHRIEVFTPDEIGRRGGRREGRSYVRSAKLRAVIYRRERHRCFYCRRRLTPQSRTLDHVVPLAQGGDHSYSNVVACCFECNTRKYFLPAVDFLSALLREGRLSGSEYKLRRAALRALQSAAGMKRAA